MNLLPTTPTYTPPAVPTTTTASYYPAYPTTPAYPAYPTTPTYGVDQFQGSVAALATQVYDLQRVITAAGTGAYGNRNYQAAVYDLQTRVSQLQASLGGSYSPHAATVNDLATRLHALRSIVNAQPSYYQPTYPTTPTYPATPTYPTRPPTYYPQPGYPQQPGYQRPMDPMRWQRRMERLQRREQMIHWRQQQLMQQQQNPLAQIIGAFSGLANGGIR